MAAPLAPIDPRIFALLGDGAKGSVSMPFGRDILLVEHHVAGTHYRDLGDAPGAFEVGQVFALVREPDNEHDPLAIKLLTPEGLFVGYVPRVKNEAIARLLDAGKTLFGKLERKEKRGDWWSLEVQLYLRDL